MSNPASSPKPEIAVREVGTSRPVCGSITFSTPSERPADSLVLDPLAKQRRTLDRFKGTDSTEIKQAALTAALNLFSDSK